MRSIASLLQACSVLSAALGVAHAQSAPRTPVEVAQTSAGPQLRQVCGDGHFRLEGAGAGADEAGSFSASWIPVLDQIAACGKLLALSSSCLEIRGHYDEVEFRGAQAIVGGDARAQRLRAESRASRSADELRARGVPASVLRQTLPPLDFATFRGVTVDVSPNCRDEVAGEVAGAIVAELRRQEAATAASRARPERDQGDQRLAEADTRAETTRVEPPADSPLKARDGQRPRVRLDLFATVAPHLAGFPAADRGAVVGSVDGDIGARVRNEAVYAGLRTGLGLGFPSEDRLAWLAAVSAGYRFGAWLELGLAGSHRWQTSQAGGPNLDQAWGAGVEATHRLVALGSGALQLWGQFGAVWRTRRGEVVGGDIRRIVPVTNVGPELCAGVRFESQVVP